MYFIYRNNRKFRKNAFKTYEQARQEVRKFIRKNVDKADYNSLFMEKDNPGGVWDAISRSPTSIGALNFEIRRAS